MHTALPRKAWYLPAKQKGLNEFGWLWLQQIDALWRQHAEAETLCADKAHLWQKCQMHNAAHPRSPPAVARPPGLLQAPLLLIARLVRLYLDAFPER